MRLCDGSCAEVTGRLPERRDHCWFALYALMMRQCHDELRSVCLCGHDDGG